MKFKCDKKNLIKGINIVMKAVSFKTTLPILKCILIESVGEDKLKLVGNDTEIGIETIIDAEIIEGGSIAIDSKLFFDIIRSLPEDDINITLTKDNKIQIDYGKSMCNNFKISCFDSEDFIFLQTIDRSVFIEISPENLKNAILQTIFSISINSKNKLMSGEFFNIKGDKLIVSALDGHRIAQRKVECINKNNIQSEVIIPGKSLMELTKIIEDEDVYMYIDKRNVSFEFGNTRLVTRVIDGDYFKVDEMLACNVDISLEVNRKKFLECVERSTLMVRENERKALVLEITDNNIALSIESQIGTMKEEIDVKKEGNDIRIGFNPRFLTDVMKSIDDENIKLYMLASKAPCIIKNDKEDYIYLVLPINIG